MFKSFFVIDDNQNQTFYLNLKICIKNDKILIHEEKNRKIYKLFYIISKCWLIMWRSWWKSFECRLNSHDRCCRILNAISFDQVLISAVTIDNHEHFLSRSPLQYDGRVALSKKAIINLRKFRLSALSGIWNKTRNFI